MAYTEKMVATLRNNAPLDLAKAHSLASELNVSYRSVISKAKQLGIAYVAKQPVAKKPNNEPTKAQILAQIRTAVGLSDRDGDLTKAELVEILNNLG